MEQEKENSKTKTTTHSLENILGSASSKPKQVIFHDIKHDGRWLCMREQVFDGYSVGTGVEYPGIVLSAENQDKLIQMFKDALSGHQQLLERHGIVSESHSSGPA